ncbi:MAG: pentapeptide repeat-containing protein [Methylococcaceae bacterium]
MPERYLVGEKFLKDEKWYEHIFNSSLKAYSILFFISAITIVTYSYFNYYNAEFYENIWVEAHGMLFDLALFGIVYTWLINKSDKRREIRNEVYSIDDFRMWKDTEASFRISGSVKRLNRLGITVIKLNDCNLESSNLSEVDLTDADLLGTNLRNANMKFSILRGADLREADFRGADLFETDFRGAKYNSFSQFDKEFNPDFHQMVNLDKS